jgi:aryl-alcohol dehydrogenase-like predicted oxidoreductase
MKFVSFQNKIALGSAQFGLNYGISNQFGKIETLEISAILSKALAEGFDTLDTAIAYGDSEQRLGEIGISSWKVVSKLPPIPTENTEIFAWVEQSINESLQRLKISQLYGLLLHRPEQLLSYQGERLYQSLDLMKAQGLVKKIGISIYSPTELENLCERFSFDLIQAPYNILDRSLERSGWLSRLNHSGVEVHVRSIFLQGLLLMNPLSRPAYFSRWRSFWQRWEQWLTDTQLTPLQVCLGFVLANPDIDRVVVGVDSRSQLQEILVTAMGQLPSLPDDLCCDDPDLINPSRWKLL